MTRYWWDHKLRVLIQSNWCFCRRKEYPIFTSTPRKSHEKTPQEAAVYSPGEGLHQSLYNSNFTIDFYFPVSHSVHVRTRRQGTCMQLSTLNKRDLRVQKPTEGTSAVLSLVREGSCFQGFTHHQILDFATVKNC